MFIFVYKTKISFVVLYFVFASNSFYGAWIETWKRQNILYTLQNMWRIINFRHSKKSPFVPEEEEEKEEQDFTRVRQQEGAKKRTRMMMRSSGLIGGQDHANDVSPSGKLMLKYGPGWTIRGAQAGSNRDQRGNA